MNIKCLPNTLIFFQNITQKSISRFFLKKLNVQKFNSKGIIYVSPNRAPQASFMTFIEIIIAHMT